MREGVPFWVKEELVAKFVKLCSDEFTIVMKVYHENMANID